LNRDNLYCAQWILPGRKKCATQRWRHVGG